MQVGILGKKVGMTQVFDEKGSLVPVTVVDTSGCVVTQVKTPQTDGYSALQVGIGSRKPQNVKKSLVGHYKKAAVPAPAHVQEIRFDAADDLSAFKTGTVLPASVIAKGDFVDVTSTSRGKGFAGVMKRHGFSGKDATHGTRDYFRHGGSNGSNTFPGRVLKNKGMPGQLGNVKRTLQNARIVDVLADKNCLLILGSIPGNRNAPVLVRLARKRGDHSSRGYSAPAAETKEATA